MKKGILLLALLTMSLGATAQRQAQMNAKTCGDYRKADQQLNQLYQQVLKLYAKDAVFLKAFKASQVAWLKFRDAQAEALYPKRLNQDKQVTYGSVYSLCSCQTLTSLTNDRNKQLKVWVVGIEEGDTCSGSVRAKAQ
ncbi:lysozyme inhibitor LprI family protein [Hymenobacter sp. GOD-10R]|uniref:lysozyme inhibitor LprI family protein n=1 Tax=Hymenobacter sp. GOD-10R TaxID=3093922 RepID=UPI002D773EF5|nr:lysozyme inhibitor LprI family protein [Hymenobacter sp. GOD-10R]WRQ29768.1 lysozyme inhibitor LprI family protein [Hymenobacter sp. GOD-10R]